MPKEKQKEPTFLASENPNPVIRASLDGVLEYANTAADDLLMNWGIDLKDRLPKEVLGVIAELKAAEQIGELEVQVNHHIFLLHLNLLPQRNCIDIYGFDITLRKNFQSQVAKLKNYDQVTGLPNRRQFLETFDKILETGLASKSAGALLIIDINKLKLINASLGHQVGDQVLRMAANRLMQCVPQDYFIARLSGDEFAVLRTDLIEEANAANLAQIIIDNFGEHFVIHDHDIAISICIGVSIYPIDGTKVPQLIINANLALAKAKAKAVGSNHYEFYKHYMRAASEAKRSLLKDLRFALEREQLVLFYQPQFNLKTEKLVGMEALVRWQHPKHGLMTPGRFTQLAEEGGLMIPMEYWILRTACAQTKLWHDAGFPHLRVAVNISPVQFNHEGLVETVEKALADTGLPATALELEIIENALIDDMTKTVTILQKLSKLGVMLAIDDFGTGYSSLNYLKNLPVDKLKIDRSFIVDIGENTEHGEITDDIIKMGHKLNMVVIAEGIENPEQKAYLLKHDCDEVQGYYFSEPLPVEDFDAFLAAEGKS